MFAMKPAERDAARQLRRDSGMSIKQIAGRLGVSKSSVSLWTRDIVLTAEQEDALRRANPILNGQKTGQETRQRRAREERAAAQLHGRALAREHDPLHRAGCMLYWAEGSKSRNSIRFTNSDADMVNYFLTFLRRCYGVPNDRVRLNINCFLTNGLSLDEIEEWWLRRLSLPPDSLRTAAVNRASKASRFRRNTLPYGTARLVVHSTFIVQSVYGAIQEYAGIERGEWLDCLDANAALSSR